MNHNELINLGQSAQKAGDILGVRSFELLSYPDNRMDSVDLLDVVKTIEEYVEKLKPDVLVTHHAGDLNIDHQIIHQAVMASCRSIASCISSPSRIISAAVLMIAAAWPTQSLC